MPYPLGRKRAGLSQDHKMHPNCGIHRWTTTCQRERRIQSVHRTLAKLTQECVPVIYTRRHAPYTRALLNGPLAMPGRVDFWSTDSHPTDLRDKIPGHWWEHAFQWSLWHPHLWVFFLWYWQCDILFSQSCKFHDLNVGLGGRRSRCPFLDFHGSSGQRTSGQSTSLQGSTRLVLFRTDKSCNLLDMYAEIVADEIIRCPWFASK